VDAISRTKVLLLGSRRKTVLKWCVALGILGVLGFAWYAYTGSPHDSRPRALQSILREDARDAPVGRYAYWIGPEYRGSRVLNGSGSQGQVSISYGHTNAAGVVDVSLDVITYPDRGEADTTNAFSTQRRMPSGQDVQIRIRVPRHPNAQFVREVRSAIQAVPMNVEYAGSND
jgi:hypothetical protein